MAKHGTNTVQDAADYIDKEGVDSAVVSYIRASEFADARLRGLWERARKAIVALTTYVNSKTRRNGRRRTTRNGWRRRHASTMKRRRTTRRSRRTTRRR